VRGTPEINVHSVGGRVDQPILPRVIVRSIEHLGRARMSEATAREAIRNETFGKSFLSSRERVPRELAMRLAPTRALLALIRNAKQDTSGEIVRSLADCRHCKPPRKRLLEATLDFNHFIQSDRRTGSS